MSYVILPSRSLRQPAGRLVVRPEIAAIAEAVIDCRSQAHAAELTTGRAVTRGSSGGTTEQSIYGYRNRFPGNSTNSYWSVSITAIGTGEFTVLFGDVRYNAYAVDSLQGYCCDFNAQAGGAPTLTHSANTTALGWYDGGSHYTVGIAGPGGNVNSVAWRRATTTNYITAALGSTIGTTTVYHPANITGTTWNVGGFKALGNGALHPNLSLGYALLLRRWADDELLRDVAVDPYGAVFRADPARRIFLGPAAGGIVDVTQALTGQGVTTAYGTLSASVGGNASAALSGQSVTSAYGTLAPSVSESVALSGQSVTSSYGTLAPSIAKALTGQSVTSTYGTLTPKITLALTGQSVTSSYGAFTPSIALALTGRSVTSSYGSLTPSLSLVLTGQGVTSSYGTLTANVGGNASAALSGLSTTASYGAFSVSASVSQALTGQVATVNYGALTPALARTLSGLAASVSGGLLTPALSVALSGLSTTSAQGTIGTQVSGNSAVALSGLSVSTSYGSLLSEISKALTGQSATTAYGTLSASSGYGTQLVGQSITVSKGFLGTVATVNATAALVGQYLVLSKGSFVIGERDWGNLQIWARAKSEEQELVLRI